MNWFTGPKSSTPTDTDNAGETEVESFPEGYDDPHNLFFIPEDIRPHYLATTSLELSELFEQSREIARRDARMQVFGEIPADERGRRSLPDPELFATNVAQRQKQVLNADGAAEHYLARAQHAHKLNEALVLARQEKERQRNETRSRVQFTCEVCQEVHPTVKARTIRLGVPTTVRKCCERCEHEIVALAAEALRMRLSPTAQRNVQTIVATIVGH